MTVGPRTDRPGTGAQFVGASDLGGRSDALQVMVGASHAFISHPFSGGFAVLDIADPRQPRLLTHVDAEPSTKTLHLQLAGDLLVCTREADRGAAAAYGRDQDERDKGFAAGLSVFDVSDPARPRRAGGLAVEGYGIHRLWWTGGAIGLASYRPPRAMDYLLATIDMSDPIRPRISGTWSPPFFGAQRREPYTLGLHHAIGDGAGRAYGGWRDGGVAVLDVSAPRTPRPVAQAEAASWGGAMTHTTLPLPGRGLVVVLDEAMTEDCHDGVGGLRVLDARSLVPLGEFPVPADADYCARPGRFGPHNLHENRPGAIVTEDTVFCAYQNAGMRWYDIRDAGRPRELGRYLPEPAARTIDPRTGPEPRTDSADVFVTSEGLAVVTDMNGGVTIISIERA